MDIGKCRVREVWSWGAGTHGQLACGTLIDALTPQRVEALSDAALIVDIACGGAHGIAVFGTAPALVSCFRISMLSIFVACSPSDRLYIFHSWQRMICNVSMLNHAQF